MMKKYSLEDVHMVSWEEFGQIMDGLVFKIQESGVNFDIIAPILRSGGVPGLIIASKLNITKILPLQLKYSYNPVELKQILSIPKLLQDLPENTNILICEANTSSGDTAKKAIELIKQEFPSAKLYYATVTKVFGGSDSLEGVEEYFYGIQTDENLKASSEQIQELKLRPKVTVFPWEIAENEIADINSAYFD